MCPVKSAQQMDVKYWSKRLESVRKDVECTFGSLKRRFRMLRLPIEFATAHCLDVMFKMCCMLHNMLLEFDGLADIGQDEADWTSADLEADE
eukprot:2677874-Pleurochrysis_carterae.AAC.1